MGNDRASLLGSPLLRVAARIRSQIGTSEADQTLLLTGGIGSGKTAAGLRLVSLLRSYGVRPGGVLAPRVLEGDETIGYSLVDLATNATHPFAGLDSDDISMGRYFASAASFQGAERILLRAIDHHTVVFVDEVGRLELDGRGHAAAVRRLLQSNRFPVLLVRDTFVESVVRSFGISEPWIVRVSELREGERLLPGGTETFWEIVHTIPYPLLITNCPEDGFARSRPMHLVDHDRRTMWFATSRSSRKVRQIHADSHVTVLFVDSERYNYAAFYGHAHLVDDPRQQQSLWRNEWEESWPRGPSDPDFVLVRIDGVRADFLRGYTGESGQIHLA